MDPVLIGFSAENPCLHKLGIFFSLIFKIPAEVKIALAFFLSLKLRIPLHASAD